MIISWIRWSKPSISPAKKVEIASLVNKVGLKNTSNIFLKRNTKLERISVVFFLLGFGAILLAKHDEHNEIGKMILTISIIFCFWGAIQLLTYYLSYLYARNNLKIWLLEIVKIYTPITCTFSITKNEKENVIHKVTTNAKQIESFADEFLITMQENNNRNLAPSRYLELSIKILLSAKSISYTKDMCILFLTKNIKKQILAGN